MSTERAEPPLEADERTMLGAWLDYQRATLEMKCAGLGADDLVRRSVPPSSLSLIGLVRHMAEVERNWFQRVLAEDATATPIWFDPAVDDDRELVPLDDADWATDLAVWHAECETSRRIAAGHQLDDVGVRRGEPCSLRWIYVHMVEEYARHNGHADLLRELIDGQVGC